LDIASVDYFFVTVVQSDPQQAIPRQNISTVCGGVRFDRLGNNAILCIDPGDTIVRGSLMLCSLQNVQHAGRDEQASSDQQPPLSCSSKPQGDTTAHRPPGRADLGQDFSVIRTGLKVHKVTSIDNRLRMKRQTKCWKVLRYLNAQRRVIDTEPAGEWINREHR